MSDLPDPPPDISLLQSVRSRWEDAWRKIRRGEDAEFAISKIYQSIIECEANNSAGLLDRTYNWDKDIYLAKYYHDTQIDRLKRHNATAARWYASAMDLAERNDTLVRQLLQDGMKHILLLHGATAIACLNALF